MANMITYEGIYDILRKEKIYPELQKIPEGFIQDVTTYLHEKAAILESQKQKDSIFAEREIDKTARQLENIKKMLKELYEKRENKIVKLALIGSRSGSLNTSSMIKEEKEMYGNVVESLNFYRANILKKVLNKEPPSIKEQEQKKEGEDLKSVRFINPVPQFVGANKKKYGPFEEKNTADLPSDVAELLIKNKRAEEI